jgi:short-subunit dehydrogenase
MPAERALAGRRALVTGASAGIGVAFAEQLAARGADLVITARRAEKLRALADKVTAAHGVKVDVVTADLGTPGGAAAVWSGAGAVDILINNAGFGTFRTFGSTDWQRDLELIQLNVTSLVELSHRFVEHHRRSPPAHRVYLMNVASTAAFQAVPNFAVYAATKHFVRSFTEAIHYELRGTKISATCVCPGGTVTEFHDAAGAGNYGKLANMSMLTAERVAEIGLRAMLRGKKTVVTGFLNKLSCWFSARAPSGVSARAARWVLGAPRAGELPARTGEGT